MADNSHLTRISDFRAELSNRNSALSVQRGQFAGQVCYRQVGQVCPIYRLTYRLDCFASLAMTGSGKMYSYVNIIFLYNIVELADLLSFLFLCKKNRFFLCVLHLFI